MDNHKSKRNSGSRKVSQQSSGTVKNHKKWRKKSKLLIGVLAGGCLGCFVGYVLFSPFKSAIAATESLATHSALVAKREAITPSLSSANTVADKSQSQQTYSAPKATVDGAVPNAESVALQDLQPQCFTDVNQAYDYLTMQENARQTSQSSLSTQVNINTASEAELTSLSGIGSSKAQEIILYREAFGSFTTVDDLTKVKGIGEKTVEKNRTRLTVD